ncbi:allantoate amidohydrolase [Cobetia amphilecti]|uniref:allantoate amidohydrolase n=1 Tax=Cobetia amphilecti TaxID=1055104 RepID=UPI002447913A|nr:allantoate amidohydrolase [Cobetia litoralis]MDH2420029.1 allantoate amidohydrolase [Cobetia litoralis]MDH2422574.1 allantoate amidohydrolase [Cobetia litoralis]
MSDAGSIPPDAIAPLETAADVLAACDTLAVISRSDSGIDRRYLTPEHAAANATTAGWLKAAGLRSWQDGAGNLWGRWCPPALTAAADSEAGVPRLVIGSHLDSVPDAGRYDGILGVLLGVAALTHFRQRADAGEQSLPFALEVVGFGDEEGTRFGATLLGSHAIAGRWQSDWERIEDEDGIPLGDALERFGLSGQTAAKASLQEDPPLGYLEVHIEQGPVLEAENLALGTVTGIAGARRFAVNFVGQAGHAGTTPMALRQDALCAAAEWTLAVESLARDVQAGKRADMADHSLVATVGCCELRPGAVNVIPGGAALSLDIRALDDAQRDRALDELLNEAHRIAARRGLTFHCEQTHAADAVACDEGLMQAVDAGIAAIGQAPFRLPSGAGHDAMAVSHLCPVGMLFLRCERGISHHPLEAVTEDDVAKALAALIASIEAVAVRYV